MSCSHFVFESLIDNRDWLFPFFLWTCRSDTRTLGRKRTVRGTRMVMRIRIYTPPPSLPSSLPSLLTTLPFARTQLVELKNGETYNGHLVSCDNYMNITLREVTLTSKVSGVVVFLATLGFQGLLISLSRSLSI